MKDGRDANSYRMTPWKDSGDKVHEPEVVKGAEGGTVAYPKHVKDADGNTHVVQDAEHEETILALPSAVVVPAEEPPPVAPYVAHMTVKEGSLSPEEEARSKQVAADILAGKATLADETEPAGDGA